MVRKVPVLLTVSVLAVLTQSAGAQVKDPFPQGGISLIAAHGDSSPAPYTFTWQTAEPSVRFSGGVPCEDACYQGTWQAFGEFLELRPANDRVAYAVPINGAIVPPSGVAPVQVGRIATADIGFQPGFRVGASHAFDECSRIGLSYTHFDSEARDQVSIDAPYVLRSMVSHPGTQAAPTDFLAGSADSVIRFRIGDVDFRRTWLCDDRMSINYVLGVRYAHLDQNFGSLLSDGSTLETVDTRLRFDGGGIRLGLEGQRRAACSGLMIYGSAAASFLGGQFVGNYVQGDNYQGNVVTTGWTDDRIVSILDAEVGIGWVGCGGRLRVSAGYLISAWFNVPKTEEFIHAIHTNNLSGLQDTLSFDGLVLRTEVRW